MKGSRMGRFLPQNLFAQQPAGVQVATLQMMLRRFKYGCRLQENLFKSELVVFTPKVFQSYLAPLNCDNTGGDRRRDLKVMRFGIRRGDKFSIQFQIVLIVLCFDGELNLWHTNLLPRARRIVTT
jgi:hypothetical protein